MPRFRPVLWARQTADGRSAQADGGRLLNFYAVAPVNPEESDLPVKLQGSPGYTQGSAGIAGTVLATIPVKLRDSQDRRQIVIVTSSRLYLVGEDGTVNNSRQLTYNPYPYQGFLSIATDGTRVMFPSTDSALHGISIVDVSDLNANEMFMYGDDAAFTPISVAWVEGYLVVASEEGVMVHFQRNKTDFNKLDTAFTVELTKDNFVHLVGLHNVLYAFYEETVELWILSGTTGFAFKKHQNFNPKFGCLLRDRNSIVSMTTRVLFYGSNDIIYAASGADMRRVSNEAVEYAIRNARAGTRFSGYSYIEEGHEFYGLKFRLTSADRTAGEDRTYWVYDAVVGLWHERNEPVDVKFVQRCGRELFMLTYDDSALFDYSLDIGTYLTERIEREGVTPVLRSNLQRFNIASFQVQIDKSKVDYDDDDVLTLEWSDDGQKTWHWLGQRDNPSGPETKKINQPVLRWNVLGQSREGRNMRVTVLADQPVTMLGAYIELQGLLIN